MNAEREQLRDLVGQLFRVEECADEVLGYIEQGSPALHWYLALKASGRIARGLGSFGSYLNQVPERLFDHLLVLSLEFFRRPLIKEQQPHQRDPELSALAGCLWADEQYLDAISGTDGELYAQTGWLANLIQVREQNSEGLRTWLKHYPEFAGMNFTPPSYPVLEWLAESN